MTLQDIFDLLSTGEFAQLDIGNLENGGIEATDYKTLSKHVQLGLTALHTKFQLRRGELTIQRDPSVDYYRLHSDFALSNIQSTEPVKYIQDNSVRPFQDNLIKIEEVIAPVGDPIYINNTTEARYVLNSPHDTLWFNEGITEDQLKVVYREDHPSVVIDQTNDPSSIEISLAPSYVTALLYYVAARIMAPLDRTTEQGGSGPSARYMAMFEGKCTELGFQNVTEKETTSYNRRRINGWP